MVLAISAIIFLVVAGLVLYMRFSLPKTAGDTLPPQDFGNPKLEITWTVIPLLIVTAMFFFLSRTMHAVDPPPTNRSA